MFVSGDVFLLYTRGAMFVSGDVFLLYTRGAMFILGDVFLLCTWEQTRDKEGQEGREGQVCAWHVCVCVYN
jgi:hypothetical protein